MKSLQSGPSTPTSSSAGNDVEKGELAHQYAGQGTECDPYVVKFGEGDAGNPLNFRASRKWWIVVNVGMTTLCTFDSAASGSDTLRFPRFPLLTNCRFRLFFSGRIRLQHLRGRVCPDDGVFPELFARHYARIVALCAFPFFFWRDSDNSTQVLGFAFGPMMWAPLSELYGRRAIFAVSFGVFVLFQIGAGAAQNIETMLLSRCTQSSIPRQASR